MLYKIKYTLAEFNCNNLIILSTAQICCCHTQSLSLSTACIRLSLSHAVALLVYRACISVLVACCCSPCLWRIYVCPCLMTLDKESNCVRRGHPSIYWKKKSTFYTHVFLGQNTHKKKAGSLILSI